MFKKYLNDSESKETQNLTNFFIDVETYHKMNADSKSRTQRDTHAQFIFKFVLMYRYFISAMHSMCTAIVEPL